ncbi:hypothetical protein BWI17_01560 [Betaproteobacteria bacterium GR16-43]|nr:hypothetical protein BWI17_01560 [Betaproteobacteria bacterium GR16-43]
MHSSSRSAGSGTWSPPPGAEVLAPLDPSLFAPGPERDARFDVKERWVDCANFPDGHPKQVVEFLHRQMNEEIDSLESSARNLCDFPAADWEVRMCLARQCYDEARHSQMFRNLFEKRGGTVGEYPVLNFQYRIITRFANLAARLAIQNRSFEAGGLDAITAGIQQTRADGDEELCALYEAQIADEISHVRFANEWIRKLSQADPRNLLAIGQAMKAASLAFAQVMGREGTEGVSYPADREGRLEAGFTPEEVAFTASLMAEKR